MLIKEYRIPLPLTVEEYRIAQLYMIAKKSREESSGAGSGVEILINEPYTNGPGGQGQYTKKIFHVGSHLPSWVKGLLPKSALTTEEEAWNAYPYTKTRYTCPFVEKFSIEIETYYFSDNGHQDNVFKLTGSDLRNRLVDLIDVAKDQLYGGDYVREEDPLIYTSEKTGRGPLSENWLEEYWRACEGRTQPTPDGKAIMCAYKLCRVEFRYWGMQTKLEKFIHDVALRKTMLRAHRQAWAWQDEWHGLTMEDIREIERQTQAALRKKMGADEGSEGEEDASDSPEHEASNNSQDNAAAVKTFQVALGSIEVNEDLPSPPVFKKILSSSASNSEMNDDSHQNYSNNELTLTFNNSNEKQRWQGPKNIQPSQGLHSPGSTSIKSFDIQVANWRMEGLERDSDTNSEDEFFDACEQLSESASLAKWSSLQLLNEEDDSTSPTSGRDRNDDSIFNPSYLQRVASERGNKTTIGQRSIEKSCPGSPNISSACSTTILVLVLHAGSVLDSNVDMAAKKSDVTTFRGAFESVMRQHYPSLVGHITIKLVTCPSICTESLGVLSSLSPYSFDVSPSATDIPHITHDSIPIGAIPLLSCTSPEYQEVVSRTIISANNIYQEFLKSEEGNGFCGQVCLVGDSMGSILGYDALCRSNKSNHNQDNDTVIEADITVQAEDGSSLIPIPSLRRSSSSDSNANAKFEFEISDLFMFGSPLALVLAFRKIASHDRSNSIMRPNVQQVYNLFHPTDPVATRIEPLLSARFSMLPPVNVARYAKYPLGNGQPYHLLEFLQSNPQMFSDGLNCSSRRLSEVSIQSTLSGLMDNVPLQAINSLQQKWWGSKRVDYALYCPEGLSNFPTNALPHLLHASYWESSDVIAFILRQAGRLEGAPLAGLDDRDACFRPAQPREKWIKKRTSVKLKNVAANHRANDVIVLEGSAQVLIARFMYGPLDMITLAGEKVDIHIMREAPAGEWIFLSTEVTDKTGRITYTIPPEKSLGYGLYPIKMVVRGDHTCVDFYMAVIPPKTECIVFSIDGSFTASMSVTGRDPKVRAGAVDVVRYWQELGYFIVYTTGRPDMQHGRVVSWLSQHNFPHGLVSFADGLSTDPLGHKAAYLNNLVQNHKVVIHAAYGSSKDISVYNSIGLTQKQIYIVGKASKKQQNQAIVLVEGYAAHLAILMSHGGSRPAQGNARMVIPRGYFGLPGQNASFRRRRSQKRSTSYPTVTNTTSVERSLSTRRTPLGRPTLATISAHSNSSSFNSNFGGG
ncbi:protein retinal degeneration B isoform X2 [Chrysoperla carnea]|uniref:protein retinal degeneration B isoform X2 n=1 Tax=Chrysoperla carnea TaxID=189513 RepID=UPI001D07928F|nr:protein retinal degeneration B isoform X2 [Chrysoperla carnea]